MTMSSSQNDGLVAELREALRRERAAHQDVLDAEATLREVKTAWRERVKLVEEIQQEILTGSTGRPILDRINGTGTYPDVDPDEPRGRSYDREMAAAVEAAERRKSERDGHAAEPADWRAVPIAELCAVIGPGGAPVADWLRGNMDIETAGDLAICLRDGWTLDDMRAEGRVAASLAGALGDAIATFRVDRGWTIETTYPDGIPAAWLAEPGQAPSPADSAPIGSRENPIRLTDVELRAVDRRVAADIEAGKLLGHIRGPKTAAAAISEFEAARELANRPGKSPEEETPAGGPVPAAPGRADGCGPEWKSADLEARLREALGWQGLSDRLKHAEKPPTTLEIVAALGDAWRNVKPGQCPGYRVRGGGSPAFWMGEDSRRTPTLEGNALVDRVRRVLGLEAPGHVPASPIDTGEWTLDRFRKAIAAAEGVGGTGSSTVMCTNCRAVRLRHQATCSHCRKTETVPAAAVLAQLESAPPRKRGKSAKGRKPAEVSS